MELIKTDYVETFSKYGFFTSSLPIYIYNVPSRLLPIRQWPHGNSRTWAHDVQLHIAGTDEPRSPQQVKQGT